VNLTEEQRREYLSLIAGGSGRVEAAIALEGMELAAVLADIAENASFRQQVELVEEALARDALFQAATSGNVAAIQEFLPKVAPLLERPRPDGKNGRNGPRNGGKRGRGRPPMPEGGHAVGQSVMAHPLFSEIYELLQMRWSPVSIVGHLESRHATHFRTGAYPPLPSERVIRRYRNEHLQAHEVLPPSLIEAKLGQVPVQIDLFKSLQLAYQLAEDRIAFHLTAEESQRVPVPGLDKAYETMLKIGEMLWRVGQDLGLYPRAMPADTLTQVAVGARAEANVFVFDGQTKSVQMLTGKELDMAEEILKQELGEA